VYIQSFRPTRPPILDGAESEPITGLGYVMHAYFTIVMIGITAFKII